MTTKLVKQKPFSRLSKSEQRVQIAKDVLQVIKLKNVTVSKGTYCDISPVIFDNQANNPKEGQQINKLLRDSKIECNVCAKGALFLAHIDRTNHLKLQDDLYGDSYYNMDIEERLDNIFTEDQLDLIETAFEKDIINGYTQDKSNDAKKFGGKYSNNTTRLVKICENIIKNEGTFIP